MKGTKTILSLCSIVILFGCKKDNNRSQSCSTPNLSQVQAPENRGLIYEVIASNLPFDWNPTALQDFVHENISGSIKIKGFYRDVMVGFAAESNDIRTLNVLRGMPWIKESVPATGIAKHQSCSESPMDLPSQVTPSNYAVTGRGNGKGKRAWVVDTGVDTSHKDLNINRELSRNFTENGLLNDIGIFFDAQVQDGDGHGTHVSGIIAAKDNGFGTVGLAADAEIVAIKVLSDEGQGSSIDLMQGLDYVFRNAQAGEACNLSLGGSANTFIDRAVERLGSKGILVSIAAGNSQVNASETSPARANGENVFTCSAIANNLNFATFSNFGNPPIDFAEPGVAVLSTFTGNTYARLSGTSMAAPHLAGILLLGGSNVKSSKQVIGDPDNIPDPIGEL